MNGTLGRDKLWNQQIWDDIDNAVRDEVGRIRVAQKVFPCTLLPSGQYVPADKVGSGSLSIEEGETKPFVEIWVEFTLTQSQVDSEESLHTARTLARMSANKLATAEDALLFQGNVQAKTHLQSKGITLGKEVKERNADQLGYGFLGEAVHPAFQKLKDPLKKIGDRVLDHAAAEKLNDGLMKTIKKTPDDAKFQTVKKELEDIAKKVRDHAAGGELKKGLEEIGDKVPTDDKFEDLKSRLKGIANSVRNHAAGKDLRPKLMNIVTKTADDAEFKTVKKQLEDIAKEVPSRTEAEKLKNFVMSVFCGVEVTGWKADPAELELKKLISRTFDAIAELGKNAQAGPYALFLPLRMFAAASAPLLPGLVAAADRITPLVTGGFWGTGCLPDQEGLLVSLGGEPTTIYLGIDATTAFTQVEANGIYRFRVFERIQFVARDPRAFLILTFKE